MQDTHKDDVKKVYEIGYLLVSSVPKEKVADVAAKLKDVLTKKKAEIIGDEAPEMIPLAYTMIKKIGTSNHRFDQAYFGWVKFELSASEIEEVKKAFDINPDVLRHLITITVRENTYLGKKSFANSQEIAAEGVPAEGEVEEKSASVEDMDKSIDEMVKEA